MKLRNDRLIKFDHCFPIYNWFYPLQFETVFETSADQQLPVFQKANNPEARTLALYLHIPFCDTICSFCPFTRTALHAPESVDHYMRAMLHEIEWKAQRGLVSDLPVHAIFIGGGTPSLLSTRQILALGRSLHDHFNLSPVSEFSVEMEVKSVNLERALAFREIGVTHARFGLQTFNPTYRALFNLTASLDDVHRAAEILLKIFPYVSFDMLYGMDGQTDDQFVEDIERAIAVGSPTIDFYPINNLASQVGLHRAMRSAGFAPASGIRKFAMNTLLNEIMRGEGFLPHNGHGYVRAPRELINSRPIVTDLYRFRYHEHVYGYSDKVLLGFGSNAISLLPRATVTNVASRDKYVKSMLNSDTWEITVSTHQGSSFSSRPVVLHLPYFGTIEKQLVDWDNVHPDTLSALDELVDAGLVVSSVNGYSLTQTGWYWYVNAMYYLTPKHEQAMLDSFVDSCRRQDGRNTEESSTALRSSDTLVALLA